MARPLSSLLRRPENLGLEACETGLVSVQVFGAYCQLGRVAGGHLARPHLRPEAHHRFHFARYAVRRRCLSLEVDSVILRRLDYSRGRMHLECPPAQMFGQIGHLVAQRLG